MLVQLRDQLDTAARRARIVARRAARRCAASAAVARREIEARLPEHATLRAGVQGALREAALGMAALARGFGRALRAGWAIVRPPIVFALQVLAAVIVLFEEWGWRPLTDLLARLARFEAWARLERFIAGLPPYGALVALAVPTSILLPLKFVAIYLVANGQVLAAGALFVAAKIASTALIARVFILTKPALMQIGWFNSAYTWLMPWKDAMFAMIRASWPWRYGRMVKTRVRHEAKRTWVRVKPGLRAQWIAVRQWAAEAAVRIRARWLVMRDRLRPVIASEAVRVRLVARQAWRRMSGA